MGGLDPEEFRAAVSLLADGGRQVLVTGGWFSQLLAGYLASVLRELRPGVRLVGPSASERAGAIARMTSTPGTVTTAATMKALNPARAGRRVGWRAALHGATILA